MFIIVRGGGDLATGIVHRLVSAGYNVLILETERPAAIRRQVSFCEAVYEGTATVEGITAERIEEGNHWDLGSVRLRGNVPLLVDPEGRSIRSLHPDVVVDAIIAKKNLGTSKDMAGLVIGVGPGFTAGEDVHCAIETSRGHNLGRILRSGSPKPNTGIPGNIGGYTSERVIHAGAAGVMKNIRAIGDRVEKGEPIAEIRREDGTAFTVEASISGLIRGLIRDGYRVPEGFKIADIDPRLEEYDNCFTISDKARCIAGSVLELCAAYEHAGGKMTDA